MPRHFMGLGCGHSNEENDGQSGGMGLSWFIEMTAVQKQQDLIKLQDTIYMEKVLRARAMTPAQRLAECFELSDEVLMQMLAGAMWQLETDDIETGWLEVRRRLDRLNAVHDRGRYTTEHKDAV